MKMCRSFVAVGLLLVVVSRAPAQDPKAFTEPQLDQLVAPIALYPDELIAQVLIASTYPLEIVEANRFVKANSKLKGKALTEKLEKESWDASVKSLVNFPSVLQQMNDKLDWTQKLGDAVLGQRADVMEAVQRLRKRARDAGHLETTEQQVVEEKDERIIVQPASTQVVYVPTYNPTIVYGTWPYPAYPPAYYYPRAYYPPGAAAFSFAAGVAVGAAWGYAWGGCSWGRYGHADIDIDVNRNRNVNRNIDRSRHGNHSGGSWKHDPGHRRGVRYRDNKTASRFNRGGSSRGARTDRSSYRGRHNTGRSGTGRGASGSTSQYNVSVLFRGSTSKSKCTVLYCTVLSS